MRITIATKIFGIAVGLLVLGLLNMRMTRTIDERSSSSIETISLPTSPSLRPISLLENWPLVQDRTVLSCNGYCLRVVFETDRWD